jgi:hypothetical protein
MRRPVLLAALLAGALACAVPSAGATRAVHIRGTAYEFNHTKTRLADATIRVAELPRLRATVRPDGSYDLTVPDRTKITPYIVAAGYHTIYLQTFTTAGADLTNVNFQTPTEAVYNALVALVGVPVDSAGNPVDCAIVSTFSTKNVRDLPFDDFTAYGAHGVAGATATGTPALPKPIYFNESVLPDRNQAKSSIDGGVLWIGVHPGVYTIRAHHPTKHFASFTATCRNGRIVNANPPWGLHELAPAIPARVKASWSGAKLRSLTATRVPAGAVVRVSCGGTHCPFTARTLTTSAPTMDLGRRLGSPLTRLRPGQTLTVAISAHGFNGSVSRWTIRSGATPKPVTLCVPLGETLPRARC